jgi:hypothetical protein
VSRGGYFESDNEVSVSAMDILYRFGTDYLGHTNPETVSTYMYKMVKELIYGIA